MNLNQVKKIVEQGESSIIEFKKSTGLLVAVFNTVCAFLNGDGGTVLIGVTDSGKIIGQEVSDRTRQEIANEISKLEPSAQAQISISYVTVGEKNKVIVIKVKFGPHKPYTYDGRPFHRVQSTSPRMPQHRFEQLIVERGQLDHSWESYVAVKCSIKNLNKDTIWMVVNEAIRARRLPASVLHESVKKVLESFKLLNDSGQLLNAAIVLFGESLFPRYAQCQLKMARFSGIDRDEFVDSDKLYGNIFELLSRGEHFVQKHLPLAATIVPGKYQRVETLLIPFAAFREAFLNALCHHDFGISNGYVSIAIYDDRLEITNTGGLLPGLTLERIKKGCSKLRNRLIAEVLYKCRYIEAWGRGIKNIISACKEAKGPEPKFDIDDMEFKIIFKFPYHIKQEVKVIQDNIAELSKRQHSILEILLHSGRISLQEIANKLIDKPAHRTLRDDLAYLKKLNLISLEGFGRGAKWFSVSAKGKNNKAGKGRK